MSLVPATPAAQIVRADAAFRAAIAGWNQSAPLPQAAVDAELRQQLVELRLAGDPRLYRVTLAALPPRLRADVADDVIAHRELTGIPSQHRTKKPPPIRIGAALPLATLRGLYRQAERRFAVPWRVLAAVNFVESDFGRLREASVSGALGPMQFMPSTWRSYGEGNIRSPRDAILAAARYLRAAGAAASLRTALWHYNPSNAYVDAVLRYAARIGRQRDGLAALYARRLLARTAHGWRRLD